MKLLVILEVDDEQVTAAESDVEDIDASLSVRLTEVYLGPDNWPVPFKELSVAQAPA
jgi:hypothetical protein